MLKIEKLSLDVLMPYENNPRINERAVEAVANSIKEFGFNVPVIVDKNNVIVAGHTRYEASKKLGLEAIPCYRIENLTDEQIKAYRLADNKTAELATWDFSKLEQELSELEIDMGDFGFMTDFETDEFEAIFEDDGIDAESHKPKKYKVVITFDVLDEAEELQKELAEKGYNCEVKK